MKTGHREGILLYLTSHCQQPLPLPPLLLQLLLQLPQLQAQQQYQFLQFQPQQLRQLQPA